MVVLALNSESPQVSKWILGGDGDEGVVVPAITIYVDLDDWDARAKALGGKSNSLFAGFAEKLAERFGRRRAGDGAVTLSFPVSDRTEYDMRANALSFVNVSVAGVDHGSLALPLSRYPKMTGFTEANNA
jgi:hypothetical protein